MIIKELTHSLYDFINSQLLNLKLSLQIIWLTYFAKDRSTGYAKAKIKDVSLEDHYPNQQHYKNRKKAEWVINEVIRIKAFHTQAGCRTIADAFNSLLQRVAIKNTD